MYAKSETFGRLVMGPVLRAIEYMCKFRTQRAIAICIEGLWIWMCIGAKTGLWFFVVGTFLIIQARKLFEKICGWNRRDYIVQRNNFIYYKYYNPYGQIVNTYKERLEEFGEWYWVNYEWDAYIWNIKQKPDADRHTNVLYLMEVINRLLEENIKFVNLEINSTEQEHETIVDTKEMPNE